MSKKSDKNWTAPAAIAGAAIGSAAIAAALLFSKSRKDKAKAEPRKLPQVPSGENPETD
jgi:hypothetical protein